MIKEFFKEIKRIIGDWLFPPRCPVCDKVVPAGKRGICRECYKKIKYVEVPRCCRCGKHVSVAEQEYCNDCLLGTHYYISGRALYEYKEMAGAIYRFKYGGRREYAEVFGEEMAYFLKDFLEEIKPDALIPVPMYPLKERTRGYNQAKLLANVLGEQLQIPVYDNLVRRIRNTRPLKLLNPEERVNNLKKAFILGENSVKLYTIVIVDDIYTTGSTVNEIARVLQDSGIRTYYVALAIGETV